MRATAAGSRAREGTTARASLGRGDGARGRDRGRRARHGARARGVHWTDAGARARARTTARDDGERWATTVERGMMPSPRERVRSPRGEERRRLVTPRGTGSTGEFSVPEVPRRMSAREALTRAAFPVFVAALGAFSFGYHCGVVNPALENLARDIGIANDVAAKGSVVSAMLLFAAIGSFCAGGIADACGRVKALGLSGAACALGSAACATATTLDGILFGRALVGIGVGLVSIVVPMYISELAPPEHRGILGAGPQLSIGVGILIAVVLGLPFQGDQYYAPPENWWRIMFWVACIPGVALAALANTIPESPTWLRSKGRFHESDAVETAQFGATLSRRNDDATDGKMARWADVLTARSNRRALITGVMLFFIQQFAGINAIIYFSTSIFESAGITSAVFASIAVCVVNLVGSVLATGLLDKTGRKPLLAFSFLGMAICCVSLALSAANPHMFMAPTLSLISVLAYVFIFGMGAGPVPGLLSSEIYAPAVRGKSMSLCFLSHWIFNFCIGQGFLPAVQTYGAPAVYMLFAVFSLFGFIFTSAYVIETKGKSLEQIAAELHI